LIYPNPFSEYLVVEINSSTFTQIQFEIYDVMGKQSARYVYENPERFVVNHLNLSEGLYLYRIIAEGKIIGSGKIIGY